MATTIDLGKIHIFFFVIRLLSVDKAVVVKFFSILEYHALFFITIHSPEDVHKNKDVGHCWLKSAKVARK